MKPHAQDLGHWLLPFAIAFAFTFRRFRRFKNMIELPALHL
jgi:hypothetical protein